MTRRRACLFCKSSSKLANKFSHTPTLAEIRAHTARELLRLPEPLRRLESTGSYPVQVADALVELAAEVDCRVARQKAAQ
jgi:hypothetical protein